MKSWEIDVDQDIWSCNTGHGLGLGLITLILEQILYLIKWK
jgi:hypothetical protein